MPLLDFKQMFLTADNLRNGARVDEAIAAYLEIVVIAKQEGQILTEAQALHMAGVAARESIISKESSYFRDAFNYFKQAEKLYEQADKTESLGALYRDMAITCDCAKDRVQAMVYFEKSLSILGKTEAYAELALTYDKVGLHFHELGDQETALRYIDKAIDTFRKDKPHGFYSATVLFDKAKVLTKRGLFDQAYDLALESVSWFEADHGNTSYRRRLAELYGFLALLATKLAQEKKTRFYWRKFEKISSTFDPLALTVIKEDLTRLFLTT